MSAHAVPTQLTSRKTSAARSLASQRGFTLIELLIVVVIIGILAAIAIPKFSSSKEKAFVGNMRSDLRNLITAQEGYFYENSTYYNGAVPSLDGNFKSSSPVTIALMNVTGTGWAATATHPQTARTCAVYYGTGGPLGPAVADGQVGCTP
jgi:prepilin-type N-terminal cleavage/methylation domain-containing protein